MSADPVPGDSTVLAADPKGAVPARRGDPVTLSRVSSALLFLVLVLAGVALARTSLRVDLTEDKLYTLSPATKRIVETLSDPARIEVYWGTEVPASAAPVERRLHGLLEEYESLGAGRVTVQWVTMDKAGQEQATKNNVPEITFTDYSSNQLSQVKSPLGIVVKLGDKTEVIAGLIDTNENTYNLPTDTEYQLTTALWKLSRTTKRNVGVVAAQPRMNFMNPHGGQNRFTVLTGPDVLQKTYGDQLKPYLQLDDPVPPEVKVLLVLAPSDLGEKQAYHLEQFLLRGGKVVLALDPVTIESAWGGGRPGKSGLEDWLKGLGVEVPDGVVADYARSAQSLALTQERRTVSYPYWPRALAENMDRSNPAFQDLDQVTFYWPGEIVVDEAKQTAAGRKATVLASTTESGYRRTDTTGLNRPDGPQGKTLGKKTLMVQLEGKFESHWKGKPAPDAPPPEPPKTEAPKTEAPKTETPPMGETPPATPAPTGEPAMGTEPAPAMSPEPAGTPPPPAPAPAPTPTPAPGMAETPPPAPPAMNEPAGPKGPEGEGGDKDKATPKPPRLDEGSGTLIVLADADLVSDEFSSVPGKDVTNGVTAIVNHPMGFFLFANLVDVLSGDPEIIALRSRGAKPRKFGEIDESDANAIKWANHLAAPVLVLIAGFLVYFVRRYRS